MKKITLLAVSALIGFSVESFARDQIKIVGSSTVYPFATVVAERFGKTSGFKTPVIESTGSGGGPITTIGVAGRLGFTSFHIL